MACNDLGNGSEPVMVIFCFGGSGTSTEMDDDEEVDDSASDSASSSASSPCSTVDFGWAVWNRLSDEGSAVGSVARCFPFPFSLRVAAFP